MHIWWKGKEGKKKNGKSEWGIPGKCYTIFLLSFFFLPVCVACGIEANMNVSHLFAGCIFGPIWLGNWNWKRKRFIKTAFYHTWCGVHCYWHNWVTGGHSQIPNTKYKIENTKYKKQKKHHTACKIQNAKCKKWGSMLAHKIQLKIQQTQHEPVD